VCPPSLGSFTLWTILNQSGPGIPRRCLLTRAAEVRKANSAHPPLGYKLILELGETTTKLGRNSLGLICGTVARARL
jgi:hypothetical protein